MKESIKKIFVVIGVACFFITSTAISSGGGEGLSLVNEEESGYLLLDDTCKCPPLEEAKDTIRKVILSDHYQFLSNDRHGNFPWSLKKYVEKNRRIVQEPWIELRFDECNPKIEDENEQEGETTEEEECEKKGCYYAFRVQLEVIYEYNVTTDSSVTDTIYPFATSSSSHFGLPCEQGSTAQ